MSAVRAAGVSSPVVTPAMLPPKKPQLPPMLPTKGKLAVALKAPKLQLPVTARRLLGTAPSTPENVGTMGVPSTVMHIARSPAKSELYSMVKNFHVLMVPLDTSQLRL